jgi:predicted unusual protein kinase regulating ubiquinone biosynthesis (AarF/ABC1/UbiB family)
VLDSHLVASLSDLRLGQLVLEVTEMIRKYQLQIPTDLFMMIKALVTAEGTVKLINPEMDLATELRPHLKRLATQRFSPEAILRGVRISCSNWPPPPPGFPSASAISSRRWSGVNCESDLNTATWAACNSPSKKYSAG